MKGRTSMTPASPFTVSLRSGSHCLPGPSVDPVEILHTGAKARDDKDDKHRGNFLKKGQLS